MTDARRVTVPTPPEDRVPSTSTRTELLRQVELHLHATRRAIMDTALAENAACVQLVTATLQQMFDTDDPAAARHLVRVLLTDMHARWSWARKGTDGSR